MLCLLPLAGFAALLLAHRYWSIRRVETASWRRSLLVAGIVWGVLATAIAEILSALHLFGRFWVAALWALASAGALSLFVAERRRASSPVRVEGVSQPLPGPDRTLVAGAALLLSLVGLVALVAAPNNWDSMTYHMPRVLHWIQNQSVAHYPTHIVRQLYLNPWSEFAVAQLQMLSGGDHLANLVQWASLIGSVLGVSLIAWELGADRRGQMAAAVIAATLPMGILQGSSTQTDLTVAFWLVCFVYGVLESRRGLWSWETVLCIGASLGLALLTKATAYLFAAPFLLWLGVMWWRRLGVKAWKPGLLVATIVVAINFGHSARNLSLFGSPLGISQGVVNRSRSLPALLSNLLRNAAAHATTPSASANRFLEDQVSRCHRLLGVDVNDPRTTWRGSQFHIPGTLSGRRPPDADEAIYAMFHEDLAGNPVHFLLLLLSIGLVLARRALRRRKDLWAYGSAAVAASLLFCWVLKWQPWHSRLHLPLFLLWSPFVAVAFSGALPSRLLDWLCFALLLAALPWGLLNATRPLLGEASVFRVARLEQYFTARPELLVPYLGARERLSSHACREVGLVLGPDDAEYPLWVVLKGSPKPPERIEHVEVGNVSGKLRAAGRFSPFAACAVISLVPQPAQSTPGSRERVYLESWAGGRMTVRIRVP